jgi:NADH-quinone oxidoreductase subunit N
MNSYRLIAPLLALSASAFLLFGVDAWTRTTSPASRRISFWVMILGLVATGYVMHPPLDGTALFARQMLVWDGLSVIFSWITLATLLLVTLLSDNFSDFQGLRLSTYYGLLLLAGAGLIFLVSANDFLMIFLGIELFGVPSFIIAGYLRHSPRSGEAAIKLFLISAFSTAMLLYGIAILYGISGSTSLTQLHDHAAALQAARPLALLAVFFVIVSFGFKIALVPFHMWVPDVFEGAPKPVAALLSVGPKVAGAAIALRVFNLVLPEAQLGYVSVLAVIAALTMTIGNIIGLQQTHIVRLLAYSSIAHMGYLLLGLVGNGELGITGVYMYGWVYLFMNLGAFAVVISLSKSLGGDDLQAYAGLARRAPWMAALMAFFLVSLAGIPPTAGFIAKFYVFLAAFDGGWVWLVALAAFNSVISVGYYFRVIHYMYLRPATSTEPLTIGASDRLTLAATSFFTLAVGIAPQFFVSSAQALMASRPAIAAAAPLNEAPALSADERANKGAEK